MGYTTTFDGEFVLDKPLKKEHADYLRAFNSTRKMQRNSHLLVEVKDELREAVGLPIGIQGEFFVGYAENFGQVHTKDVINYNTPPSTQPSYSLWCGWMPTDDDKGICWDGREKFYMYVEWLQYIINNFIMRWGYTLNGVVEYQGEEDDDHGYIVVENNGVSVKEEMDFALT